IGRFGMLDTVRDFAAEQLEPADRPRIVQRLLEHLLNLFVNADLTHDATGPMQMNLASIEQPNIDVALTSASESSHVQPGIRLILLTEMYWVANDPVGGLERLERLMAKAAEIHEPMEPGIEARA